MINLIDRNKSLVRPTTFLNPFSFMIARKNKKQLRNFKVEIDGGVLVVVLRFFLVILSLLLNAKRIRPKYLIV